MNTDNVNSHQNSQNSNVSDKILKQLVTFHDEPKYPSTNNCNNLNDIDSISRNTEKSSKCPVYFHNDDNSFEATNLHSYDTGSYNQNDSLAHINFDQNINKDIPTPSIPLEGNIGDNLISSNDIHLNKTIDKYTITYIPKESILKTGRERKLNIEVLKNHILNTNSFIYTYELRYYNEQMGYYCKLSYHDSIVLINQLIPVNARNYLEPSDIKKIYDAIKYEPSIQLKPEFICNNENYLNCLNGVINLNNIINNIQPFIISHQKEYYFLNCINANYIPNSSIANTNFQYFLNTVTNYNFHLQKLIQEVLGYILSSFTNAKKAFFIYGESNSGKSVFLKLVSSICGEENISNIELHNLSKPQYTAELFGKLLNVCSELPDEKINETGIFKALISETDKVTSRKLYQQPLSFYNKAKLLFATNNLPEIKTESYKDNTAFFNRLIIIPFIVSIPEENQDKYLFSKLMLEKDFIFSWAIDGLIDYIKNDFKFHECSESSIILNHYRNNGNSVLSFINEKCTLDKNSYIYIDKLFEFYKKYCDDNCLESPTSKDRIYLKKILQEKYKLNYRRLHRADGNKYGFEGLYVHCE